MTYLDLRQRWAGPGWVSAALGLGTVIGVITATSSLLVPVALIGGVTLAFVVLLQPEAAILAILLVRPMLDLAPSGLDVPGFAKEFGLSEVVALLLALGGGFLILTRRIDPFRIPLALPFAALLLVATASFAASEDPQRTAIAVLRLWGQLSLYVLVYFYLKERKQVERLVAVIILSALPPVLWGFGQILAGHGSFAHQAVEAGITQPRLEGPFGGGLSLGIFLIIPTALALMAAMEWKGLGRKLAFAVIAIFMLTALYFTLTRTAWLAIGGIVAILGVFRYRSWLLVAPPLLLIIVVAVPTFSQRWAPVFTRPGETSVQGRLLHTQGALNVFLSHPVLGAGFGVGDVQAGLEAKGVKLSPAHTDYGRILADTGVMGLVAFVWLLGATGWEAIKAYRGAADPYLKAVALAFCAIWAAFLLMRATSNILTHQVFQYYFWALAAAAVALPKIESRMRKKG